jgi:hypothetical protein
MTDSVKTPFVDENVATVPFNVPFKVPPLKDSAKKIALAMNQKLEVITPYYLSLSSLLISLSYLFLGLKR